jgi:carboxyl-terminal processing protease
MKEEVIAYLNDVLDYIQEKSVRREHINWQTLRQEAFALAADAWTKAETYPAIERALELLGDHHSMFFDPQRTPLQWIGFNDRA